MSMEIFECLSFLQSTATRLNLRITFGEGIMKYQRFPCLRVANEHPPSLLRIRMQERRGGSMSVECKELPRGHRRLFKPRSRGSVVKVCLIFHRFASLLELNKIKKGFESFSFGSSIGFRRKEIKNSLLKLGIEPRAHRVVT